MRNQTDNTVGDAVRARREALGLSQDKIAAAAEVSGTTWRKLETGDPSTRRPAVAHRIETALGWPRNTLARIEAGDSVDVDALVGGQDAGAADMTRLTERLDGIERALADLAKAVSHLTQAPKRGRALRR